MKNLLLNFIFLFIILSSANIWSQNGRIAVVADGNYRDSDDIAATPVSLAILKAKGLQNKLVHYSHSCDLVKGNNDPGGTSRETEMQNSCDGTDQLWGPFPNVTKYYNCKQEQDAAVTDLKNAINASSSNDPLYIILAGETDIIYYAVNAANFSKRQYVYIISHHIANESGDFFDLQDIFNKGVKQSNFKRITDQNTRLKTALSTWNWAKNSSDAKIKWLYERGFKAQQSSMNYPAIVGSFDCSDAGLIYYWATSDEYCTVSKLQSLLTSTNTNPVVNFIKPLNNNSFNTGANLEVEVSATDADGIVKVELFKNGIALPRKEQIFPYQWGFSGQNDPDIKNLPVGTYILKAVATDGSGNTGEKSITVKVLSDAIRIEAEDFTQATSSIKTQPCSEGTLNIGWIKNGNTAKYNVDFPSSGNYSVDFRVAGITNGTTIEVFSGSSLLGTTIVNNVSGWQNWKTVSIPSINIPSSGQRLITLKFVKAGFNGYLINMNWLAFEKSSGSAKYSLIKENELNKDFDIYPNPSDSQFKIKLNNSNYTSYIYIYDTNGILVYENKTSETELEVNKALKSGLYLVKVVREDDTFIHKLYIK